MELAPIIVFVYNRPNHTLATLQALANNDLANQSILYVFADGPKPNATKIDLKKIADTRDILRQQQWCKEVHIIESDINKGLANSVIKGVSEVVNRYGKVVVLEDDLVTSRGFLRYMNDALNVYENEEQVMHISGFMYPHKENLPETFFYNVPLCWGWATWQRAWKHFVSDTDELISFLDTNNYWDSINKFGGDHLGAQLKLNKTGRLKTWFIKWHVSVFKNKGFTLYPGVSLVNNIGFDNSGVHNGHSTNFEQKNISNKIDVLKQPLIENDLASKIIIGFYKKLTPRQNHTIQKVSFFTQVKKVIPLKRIVEKIGRKIVLKIFPEITILKDDKLNWDFLKSTSNQTYKGNNTKLYEPYRLSDTLIGDYTYIAQNARISLTIIGKFCSIGPNLVCGWGIHPINGISTSPMFYSTKKQNGVALSGVDKIDERKRINIGNDVFIGANVTILDGVTIGDGAIIGAGAVVSKDIPPYAIAVGSPIKVIRYRFSNIQIDKLLKIKWWDFDEERLKDIERYFFDIDKFIEKYYNA